MLCSTIRQIVRVSIDHLDPARSADKMNPPRCDPPACQEGAIGPQEGIIANTSKSYGDIMPTYCHCLMPS